MTVIDEQGRVLGDSEKEPYQMEDHKDRPEVIKALQNGFGQSIRPSDTMGYNMKYVAVRVDEGGQVLGVLRFALPLSEVQLEIRVIYRAVLFGVIAATAITLTVTYVVSRSITHPIRQMQETAQRFAKGDFRYRYEHIDQEHTKSGARWKGGREHKLPARNLAFHGI